ncbi:hypothetical protein ACFXTI_022860 [Malus domestica]
MGAICCLEKKGLPLHQGSSQNDDRRGQTFSKVLKKEEIGQIKILEVQEGSFHKRKFKCALKRTTCLYKKSALDGISEIEEASSEFEGANSKIEEVLAFSKAGLTKKKTTGDLPFQTCPHLSHATSTLDEAQKSKRHLAFPDASAPVTRKLSFAEITGNLSKHRSQISKRRQSFSASSTPVICTLNFAQIMGNLSKIFGEGEST